MKDFKIYISIASALLLIYLIAEYNKPVPINWNPTFYYNDKIPFGTYIVYNQLHQLFPDAAIAQTNESIYNALHDSLTASGNYLIITRNVNLNEYDYKEVVKYASAGGSVFIAALSFNDFLRDTLKLSERFEISKKNAELNFTNDQLKSSTPYTFDQALISNNYFDKFDTAKAIVLGTNNFGHATFLDFKFGKGNLFLCANPGVFTNYSILTNQGEIYAAKALSYLPKAKNVYWDELQNGDIPPDESPVRVFLNSPGLQWAYYISLAAILIFVIFEIKRRQRIIPVIEPLRNATLEFVSVVGQVYYEKRNNANIAHKKVLYLLAHLRDEYQVKTSKLDNELVEKLKVKLGLESSFAMELVAYLNYISTQGHVTDRELIELNKMIEKLYKQSA